MLKTRVIAITIIIISFGVFTGCRYDKILKSDDFDLKYEKAKMYYGKGDYARALPLLDQLLTVKIGSPEEKEIRYYMAYCYYGQGDYFTAAGMFKNVFVTFPLSPEAEETLYMSAKAMYDASPRYQLDQTYTEKAIEGFQYFTDVYPKSALTPKANDLMDTLRAKLEAKLIYSAELYYNTENYQAAAITYTNVLLEFPDTRDAEEIGYKIVSSYFNFAGQSIVCRKEERYDDAIKSANEYVSKYPNGNRTEQVKSLNERSAALKEKAITEITTYKLNCNELTKED
ncbi:MAG: outer membrane protein assembly factor BamD [Chitinophagales bacterium]